MLFIAMVLDAAFGEPKWLWSRLPHPAVVIGRLISRLDRALNTGPWRYLKGVGAMGLLALSALGLGAVLSLGGAWVQIPVVAILLAQKSLVQHVQAVADGLRVSVGDGRFMVSRIVSRDCRDMTPAQVARSAIESAAENLSDGVIAPAFWFLIGGLPGLLLYKVVNTADSMIGYRNETYKAFGWAAARSDDVLNLIPARLSGVIIAVLTGQLGQWRAIARDARRHRSPNAGWPEAAMARALNVALAGPRSYDGQMRALAWVNETARQDIGADDIDASVRILWRTWAAFAAAVIVIACLYAVPVF